MKMTTFKKLLLTMLGLGVVGSLVSVGTFASFTATATNTGNSFAAGTLQITTGSCSKVSSGPNPCTGASVTATNMKPGGTTATGTVLVKNDGSLPGTYTLTLNNVTETPGTCGIGANTTCVGLGAGANPIMISVQGDNNGSAGAAYCVFGKGGATPASGVCDTLADATTADNFATFGPSAVPGASAAAQWAAAESHTFTVSVYLPTAATNIYQGGAVSFDLVWNAAQ